MAEVCIIGGGIAGISASKAVLNHNLTPYLLEKTSSIGGVWQGTANQIGVWGSLHSNTSKHAHRFSDHPWPREVEDFPNNRQYVEYFNSYIDKHNLRQYFHFNCEVLNLSREGSKFSVVFSENGEVKTKIFDYVICATGVFSKPADQFENKEVFTGQILHSGYYREPSLFANKNLVVIGKSYSASDIAFEALSTAKSVTQIYRKPYMCFRKKVNGIPYDFFLFSILNQSLDTGLTASLEKKALETKLFEQMFGNPGDVIEEWRITEEETKKEYFNLSIHSEDYYNAVKNKEIKCLKGELKGFYENGVVLTDGRQIPADFVVLGTGYQPNCNYFSDELKQILNYDENCQKVRLCLYRACLHPGVPGLAFAGFFHGFFTGNFELVSEIAAQWVSGKLKILEEELWQGVRIEEQCRAEIIEANFIYDFNSILKDYLRIAGTKIDYELLGEMGYRKGPMNAVFYWLDRPGQLELTREFISELKETYLWYDFSDSSP